MLIAIFGGLLGLIAILGVGTAFTWPLGRIPVRWRLAVSLVCGTAAIDCAVMLVLAFGGGTRSLKITAGCSLAIGCWGLLASFRERRIGPVFVAHRADRWFAAVVAIVIALNFIIATAPSTKIDELNYHMLVPKRVLEDNGLRLYREPFPAAIFPQMGFQVGLSSAHATGFPEAGNIVSWGFAAALLILITGVATDLTRSRTAGWMTGAVAAVGLYSSVWHVTSGPHALGDLATLTACLLALLPDEQTPDWSPRARLAVLCIACCTAASTKISLLPLAVVITAIGVFRSMPKLGRCKAVFIAGALWIVLYFPLVAWTFLESGSPFGLATAALFHFHFFGPDVIAQMEASRKANQVGLVAFLRGLPPWHSIGLFGAFAVLAWAAWTRTWPFKMLAALVASQALLITWLLPHEFRFMGGLQYVVLVFAVWALWTSRAGAALEQHWRKVLVFACLPWLGLQFYYAIPFLKLAAGLDTREAFVDRYVALTSDFRALDRLLPSDAVIYIAGVRAPSYYAPRPVIFNLQDLHDRNPLYRLSVGPDTAADSDLTCDAPVYANPDAVVEAFRTPGRQPEHGLVKVQPCISNLR